MDDEFKQWMHNVSTPAKLLLVEDDSDFTELIQSVAENYHCEIACESTVLGAIERLRTTKFDLIILDAKIHSLPDDGLGVLRHMHANGIEVPVVMLSGMITTELVQRTDKIGLVAFITKPTNDLVKRLNSLFRTLQIKPRSPVYTRHHKNK